MTPEKALPPAQEAVELSDRQDAEILDTLAVALHAHGDREEAAAVQEELFRPLGVKDAESLTVAGAEGALARCRKAREEARGRRPAPR